MSPRGAGVEAGVEEGVVFDCAGQSLVGVLSRPGVGPGLAQGDLGVVIAVGGPQYRVGSHRQFTLMARRLAAAGWPALRFDTRGMGDSGGDFPGFESLGPDLAAAAQALTAACPTVRRIVFWGLCDAASAIMMNLAQLPSAAGAVLLNPWVRHVDTHARVEFKQYYARRLFDAAFWRKLLGGDVAVAHSVREVSGKLLQVLRASRRKPAHAAAAPPDYRARMIDGALGFRGRQLYVLSGQDHVCAEFKDYVGQEPKRSALWTSRQVSRLELPQADHTFSNADLRSKVELATLEFLHELAAQRSHTHAHPAAV
jgi:exosortase A-associated hydrolase 1